MINNVVLVGRLTRDPELRQTANGKSRVAFTVACDRRFNNQQGQKEADFINCVAWNRTAELMAQYLHKGSLIGVTGSIRTGSYENQQGQRVYTTDVWVDTVQFLESKNAANNNYQPNNGGYAPNQNSYSSQNNFGRQDYGSNGGYSSYNGQPGGGYSNNFQSKSSYQAPQNPYAKPAEESFDTGFDDGDDGYDIASDDLPF